MKTITLLSRLAVCTAGVLLPLAAASADQLNWDNFAAGSQGTSSSYVIGNTRVNVVLSGTTGGLTTTTNPGTINAPAIGQDFQGGLTPAQNAYEMAVDFGNTTSAITVTVSFTNLAGTAAQTVNGVNFSLFDVDRGAAGGTIIAPTYAYNDQITNIQAILGASTVRPTSVTGTAAGNTVSGSQAGGFTATGTATIANTDNGDGTSGGGNLLVNYGTQNLTGFSFTYGDNTNAALGGIAQADPSRQVIALHDINFTPVPEPTTVSTIAMAGLLAAFVIFRRRRNVSLN